MSTSAAVHATDETFEEITSTGSPVLIDFYATWCGPCRQVAPIVDALANERTDITVVKVDIDEAQQTARRFGIMSVPTLIVLNSDGSISAQVSGAKPKPVIANLLDQAS